VTYLCVGSFPQQSLFFTETSLKALEDQSLQNSN
jgi:hypothetical protein